MTVPSVFTRQRLAGDRSGAYVFFVAAVRTGALALGTVPPAQILTLSSAPYTFAP